MDTTAAARLARTWLFVPGDRPERFEKAADSGADLVVVDLEDAVAAARKDDARAQAVAWVGGAPGGAVRALRVNAADSPQHHDDLLAAAGLACVVVVPKAEDVSALRRLRETLGPDASVVALVETAAGILGAADLAASGVVDRLVLGSFDLAAQLGVSPDDREALRTARGALVLASAAGGLPGPVEGVTGDVTDDDLLADDTAYAARLGFTAKLCVHPRQVPVVRAGLRPSPTELDWAREVVAAAGDGGVALVGGRMVDRPVVERARRILAADGG